MKKLCLIFATLSILSFSTISVVACNSGLGTFSNYTDEEKMVGIRNLTKDMLESNGVKIKRGISNDDIDALIEAFDLTELIENNEDSDIAILLKSSLTMYVMSNALLNEISSKIPGYGWISTKLSWQSQWGLKDLIDKGKIGASNNVSGWMPSLNSWSLSVTFLNEDKTGWAGDNLPVYARININKKLVATKDGEVCTEQNYQSLGCSDYSNPEGVWGNGEFLSRETVQHDRVGSIYQGFVSSSELLSLENIFVDEIGKIAPGVINYSPSATDFVNNLIYSLDFTNILLAASKKEVEEQFNNYLNEEPIFLSEGLETTDVYLRFKNQLYIVLFSQALNRRNLTNDDGTQLFTDDDLEYSKILMTKMFNDLQESLEEILKTNLIQEILDFKENLENIYNVDQETGLSQGEIQDFKVKLQEVIKISREANNSSSKEYNFAKEELSLNLFKKNAITNVQESLSYNEQYLDFGYNDDYKFEIQYYGRSNSEIGRDERWYKPDEYKIQDFIADSGFKNIYLENRFISDSSLISKYNYEINANSKFSVDPFGFNIVNNDVSQTMLDSLKEAISFGDSGSDLSNVTSSSWRIYHLVSLMNKKLNEEINSVFNVDFDPVNGQINQTPKIWDKNISLDGIAKSMENRDDDIAFGYLFKQKEIPLAILDVNSNQESNFSQEIYQYGLSVIDNKISFDFNIFYGKTNSYGKRYDEIIDFTNWWKDSERALGTLKVIININDNSIINELKSYWEDNVMKNQDNPDYKPSV
ncbi:hypothetical protein [Spiroplasma taiwanense]|uniref:Lipoprotein n=1 Tax=Spiroplasma taiwanense CT-1 TaxID=1276220 RepID=S5MCE2_9MOLU|nr:hypothetical protein [Spiroplasma taiwanense]AGR41403.1 hypothetical protein STAIW_v1c08150 [Spiroplasma taiwanense CT-1]